MDIKRLSFFDELQKLNLPKNEFVIIGTGPLVVAGILDKNDDLDIIVSQKLWNELKEEYPVKQKYVNNLKKNYIQIGNIEIMSTSAGFGNKFKNTERLIKKADIIEKYKVANLDDVIYYKECLNRKKDKEHILLIKKFMDSQKNWKMEVLLWLQI